VKDFDVERQKRVDKDRSFKIGGETFAFRAAVAPETILDWSTFASHDDKEKAHLAAAQAALAAARAKNDEAAAADPPRALEFNDAHMAELDARVADAQVKVEEKARSDQEWLDQLDATVLAILEPQYLDAWRRVRDPEVAHPLSLGDINELVEWLVPEVVGRPTGSPSDSSRSGGDTGTTSTDDSSSPEAEESTTST
jgi:hypothetical protein